MGASSMSPSVCLAIAVVFCAVLSAYISPSHAQIEGIYCGKENCYSVLEVTRDDDKATIMKAYRKMARIYHPDRQKTVEAKQEAEKKFKVIATAYEILRDDEQRQEYDYMLDNPEAMYYHFYQYFKRRLSPQVDVRIVIFVLISLVSVAQYYVQWTGYEEAVSFLVKQPRYRNAAKEMAKSDGLLTFTDKKKEKKLTKEDIKRREEKAIRQIVTTKLDIKPFEVKKGSFYRPSLCNTLWIQMFTMPVQFVVYLYGWARWILLYWILKREISREDKLEQIRCNLKTPRHIWQHVEEPEKEYYLKLKLWQKEDYEKYAEEQAELERKRLAEDTKYKRYQRMMRKGGPGQIVFGPEDADFDFGG